MNTTFDQTELLRMKYTRNVANGRSSLLAVIIATLVSMVTLALADTYFVFSAYLPFSFFVEGWYGWQIANGTYYDMSSLAAEDIAYYTELGSFGLIVGIVVALICILGYFLCWALSKKHPSALVIGTVFFALDCVLLLLNTVLSGEVSMIIDILLHAYIMYTLVVGASAAFKLKKLPAPIEGEAVEVIPTVETLAIPTAETVSTEETAPVETDNTPEA